MAQPLPDTLQPSLRGSTKNRGLKQSQAWDLPAICARRRSIYGTALLLVMALLLPACNANRGAFSEPIPRTPRMQEQPVDSAPRDVATGQTVPPRTETSAETTLGERLGRLDARIHTAPADSVPILQDEYQHLLDEANGSRNIQTGGGRGITDIDSAPAVQDVLVIPTSPQAGRGGDILNASYDSTLELKGLRASELRYAGAEAAPARPHESQPRARPAAPRGSTPANATTERTSAATASRTRSKGETQSGEKNLVNGVAATRAGWYAEAATQLPQALATPQNASNRTLTHYSYAQVLENTGKLKQAAEQYLKASQGETGLGHRSYISYCRVLAKSGQKDRARQLLVQFIGKNPKSDQVINARQLLQTL